MSENLTGLTHAQPRASELAAAEKVAPKVASIKGSIWAMISFRGDIGLTPDEYSAYTDRIINTVRRRFTDLWKDGIIRPTIMTRPNRRGNQETVWVVGRDENALGAGAKFKACALRDARGAVSFLEGEYLDGRGVPRILGWGECMKHLLDKAKARVADLEGGISNGR